MEGQEDKKKSDKQGREPLGLTTKQALSILHRDIQKILVEHELEYSKRG